MLVAAGLALVLTPREKMAASSEQLDLHAMVPEQFGRWKQEHSIESLVISPDVQAKLDRIYSQTLTRNYTDEAGNRIMLSIAYGSEQDRSTQVHRPEMCYSTQGFEIKGMSKGFIELGEVKLPVMKMVAAQGSRIEPITYWVMIGNSAVRGNHEQNWARLRYGLSGRIPYGLVVRVSTISADELHSYRIQEDFVRAMLAALKEKDRKLLTGAGS